MSSVCEVSAREDRIGAGHGEKAGGAGILEGTDGVGNTMGAGAAGILRGTSGAAHWKETVGDGGRVEAWIWLSCLPSVRNYGKHAVLSRFPDILGLYGADRTMLLEAGIGHERLISILLSEQYREQAAQIRESLKPAGIRAVPIDSPDYPTLLRNITDAPFVLYLRGDWPGGRCVAVVGSRRSTGYGLGMTERLAGGLSEAGFIIVSGLARGIDTAAHAAALHAGGKTAAILGNGLDSVYPPENRMLAERILRNGCLLSEYPPGTPPAPHHFPVRNRIVSGVSEAVLVVEAGERSGSLITVQCALEQGRDVFAVPGNAMSVTSRGCNRLIREGAGLVQETADMLDSLAPSFPNPQDKGRERTVSGREALEIPEQIVFGRILREPLLPDQICAQSGLSPSEVQQVLLMLELKRYAIRDRDGRARPIPD